MDQRPEVLEIVHIDTCDVLESFQDHALARAEFELLQARLPGEYALCRQGGMPVSTYSN